MARPLEVAKIIHLVSTMDWLGERNWGQTVGGKARFIGLVVRDLVEHLDRMCLERGLTHWTGEMDAREGRRVGLLRSYGFGVHSITRNRTLSWLTGMTVQRVTVVREVGEISRLDVAS
jgi:hypothetical protein